MHLGMQAGSDLELLYRSLCQHPTQIRTCSGGEASQEGSGKSHSLRADELIALNLLDDGPGFRDLHGPPLARPLAADHLVNPHEHFLHSHAAWDLQLTQARALVWHIHLNFPLVQSAVSVQRSKRILQACMPQ